MAAISLCMIVKNEEQTLERCLRCAKNFADEIIVVDTGSTDRTKEIAAQYATQVYDFAWTDDFAAARNFAFSKAHHAYCMWLDADDTLQETEQKKMLDLKQRLDETNADVVMMPYDVSFDENGKATFSYYRERVVKNTGRPMWEGRVHEVITPYGNIIYEEIHVEHHKEKAYDTDRNLRIYEKMLEEGCTLSPREKYYYGRELYYHQRYEEAVEVLEAFVQQEGAWIENQLEAYRQLAECYGHLGKWTKQLDALYRSFLLDLPRAETCCAIGRVYFDQRAWKQAAFWYETALRAEKREHGGGFIQEDCYGYLPCIQLCVCYDRMGKREKAESYNELAAMFKPNDRAVSYNRKYFLDTKGMTHPK